MTTASAQEDGATARATTAPAPAPPLPKSGRAFVKNVLSGDTIVLRGKPISGPPPEMLLSLSGITAPRIASFKDPSIEEPGAVQARDELCKMLIGQEVAFRVLATGAGAAPRAYGIVTLNPKTPVDSETDVRLILLRRGLVRLRPQAAGKSDNASDDAQALKDAEAAGIAAGKTPEPPRIVRYALDETATAFAAAHRSGALDGVVEQVRDASTLRVMVATGATDGGRPVHQALTVLLGGVRAPAVRDGGAGAEPFALEGRFFAETRLLGRDVSVWIEGALGNAIVATVTPRSGSASFAELLLGEGFAQIQQGTLASLTGGAAAIQRLRAAEKRAQDGRRRLYKTFQPGPSPTAGLSAAAGGAVPGREFAAVVTRVLSGDTLQVVPAAGGDAAPEVRVTLASIRQPRAKDPREEYYSNEARELLRRRLIGKTVRVTVDYVKPAQTVGETQFDERVCVTIADPSGANVALALVERGLAVVLTHRRDDPGRSQAYDELLLAEEKAKTEQRGMHSTKAPPAVRIADGSENAQRARQFAAFYEKQSGGVAAIVDHVVAAARLRVLVPKDQARFTVVLAGIRAASRPRGATGDAGELGKIADAAMEHTVRRWLQRDIRLSVFGVDKAGGLIGSVAQDGAALAPALVRAGWAVVHAHSASQLPGALSRELHEAEQAARAARRGVWALGEDAAATLAGISPGTRGAAADDLAQESERVAAQPRAEVLVCDLRPDGQLSVQLAGPALSKLEELMRRFAEHHAGAQTAAAQQWRTGSYCAARFSEDGQWYRARIAKMHSAAQEAAVRFVDYGNAETVPLSSLRPLAPEFEVARVPAAALDVQLGFVRFHDDAQPDADHELQRFVEKAGGRLWMQRFGAPRAADGGIVPVGLFAKQNDAAGESVSVRLVRDGLATVRPDVMRSVQSGSGGRSDSDPVAAFKSALVHAQELARFDRVALWRHGDFEGDADADGI